MKAIIALVMMAVSTVACANNTDRLDAAIQQGIESAREQLTQANNVLIFQQGIGGGYDAQSTNTYKFCALVAQNAATVQHYGAWDNNLRKYLTASTAELSKFGDGSPQLVKYQAHVYKSVAGSQLLGSEVATLVYQDCLMTFLPQQGA